MEAQSTIIERLFTEFRRTMYERYSENRTQRPAKLQEIHNLINFMKTSVVPASVDDQRRIIELGGHPQWILTPQKSCRIRVLRDLRYLLEDLPAHVRETPEFVLATPKHNPISADLRKREEEAAEALLLLGKPRVISKNEKDAADGIMELYKPTSGKGFGRKPTFTYCRGQRVYRK